MQNKTAIKIGFLMILFSVLNSIILSITLIIVLLCLAYLIINTKIVEKLGLISNTEESEDIDIKPILGEQMYIDLSEAQTGTTLTPNQTLILNGGVYTVDEKKYVFKGLKSAIAYFVYSKIIKNSDGQVTRYGFINKDTAESDRPPRTRSMYSSAARRRADRCQIRRNNRHAPASRCARGSRS